MLCSVRCPCRRWRCVWCVRIRYAGAPQECRTMWLAFGTGHCMSGTHTPTKMRCGSPLGENTAVGCIGKRPASECRAVAPVALVTELMQEEAQGEVLQRGDDGGALMELDAQRETRRTTDAGLLQSALSRDPASSGDADFCTPKTEHFQTENCEATNAAGTAPPVGVGGSWPSIKIKIKRRRNRKERRKLFSGKLSPAAE